MRPTTSAEPSSSSCKTGSANKRPSDQKSKEKRVEQYSSSPKTGSVIKKRSEDAKEKSTYYNTHRDFSKIVERLECSSKPRKNEEEVSIRELERALGFEILQVQDMSTEQVVRGLLKIMKDSEDKKRKDTTKKVYKYEFHSTSDTWQRYVKELCRIVLIKTKTGVFLRWGHKANNSVPRVENTTKTYDVLCYMKDLLESGKRIDKRGLFYCFDHHFTKQSQCDTLVQEIAIKIGCRINNLPVDPGESGRIGGTVCFEYDGNEFDCTRGILGYNIPVDVGSITNISSTNSACILVLEKHSVFDWLMKQKVYNDVPCILLCGHGQPDVCTRRMLKRLSDEFPKLPIYALNDCDLSGIEIYMTYRIGSQNMSYDSANLAVPNIQWLGVRPSDFQNGNYLFPKDRIKEMSEIDKDKLKNKIWFPSFNSKARWRKEFDLLIGLKNSNFSIESFHSLGTEHLWKNYLCAKLYHTDGIFN